MEFGVISTPTKKTPGLDDFSGKFHQIFKDKIVLIQHKQFPTRKQFPTHETSIPNAKNQVKKKYYTERKPQANIPHEHQCKTP